MALQILALDNVGVEVSGFDITQPVGDALAAELVSLWNQHGILCCVPRTFYAGQ